MFHRPLLARARALPALALACAASLLASGCVKPIPDQPNAKLAIAATPLVGPYAPGDTLSFRLTVSNIGDQDVARISIDTTLDPNVNQRSIACNAVVTAPVAGTPQSCYDSVYLQSLPKGTSATFDILVTLGARAHGTLTNSFSASALAGPAAVTATNSAPIVDNRGGTYTAFTSDGHQLALAADFVGDTLTFNGNGASVASPFTLPAGGNAYLAGANTGFLAHHDLLAGTAPLDGGTPVFLAGRSFVSVLAALDGHAFNVFEIDTPATGSPTSHVLTAQVSGATMQVCADVAPHTLATCPAASLRHYDLTLAGSVFTAVDAADADTITFQVAQANATLVLLRAEATATGRVFQVGLAANPAIASNNLLGGDNAGHWGSLTLNPGTLQENWTTPAGANVLEYNGNVTAIADAPPGLALGSVAPGPQVYLAEDGDLAILAGKPGSALDGVLQLFAF